ncbi:MAG: F0F1 ATP synthase subunit B [Bacteroidota bacterium]
MQIILPEPGLFLWTTIIFLTFFFILRRFAWKPIINALEKREQDISNALGEAEKARQAIDELKAQNEDARKKAMEERNEILKTANELADRIKKEAKDAAASEAAQEFDKMKVQIEAEKRAAIAEIKNTAASLAVEVAERILRKEFDSKDAQESYAKELISDLSNN